MRWTSIPPRGSSNIPSRSMLQNRDKLRPNGSFRLVCRLYLYLPKPYEENESYPKRKRMTQLKNMTVSAFVSRTSVPGLSPVQANLR